MIDINEAYKIIERIADSGGLDDDMLGDLKKLKDELDEREGMLKKYGESYDGENWRDRAEAAERERDEIRRKYRDRFLYGEDKKAEEVEDDKQTSREEIKREQKEDIRRDGKKQTFEELFEEREG
jgi:hypothetical protein